jgi:hypothetical protein
MNEWGAFKMDLMKLAKQFVKESEESVDFNCGVYEFSKWLEENHGSAFRREKMSGECEKYLQDDERKVFKVRIESPKNDHKHE